MYRQCSQYLSRRVAGRIGRLFALLAMALNLLPPIALAQADAVFDLLNRIGALRRQTGLAPLELNDQLNAAAQRHSQDMANTGNVDHTGSDGSTPEERIREAGYGPNSIAWGENIYGGGIAAVDDAWRFWTTSTVHRNNLLNERYREIGVGVATSANGTYYTLNFGSRPGVLPFFVDQGSVLDDPNVTLTLSNEEAAPGGSFGAMGRAVEVRVGEVEDLNGVAWQPWQRSIPFTLSNAAGQHRISVDYRDARGTLASYFRIVSLTGVQPAVTPTTEPTTQPSSTPTTQPPNSPTPQPSNTPVPTPTASATSTPTSPPPATSTSTALPTVTPGSTSALIVFTPPAARSPTPLGPGLGVIVPNLTATPTGAQPDRSPIEALIARGWSDAPLDLLGLIAGLNVVAGLIGVAALIRRSTKA